MKKNKVLLFLVIILFWSGFFVLATFKSEKAQGSEPSFITMKNKAIIGTNGPIHAIDVSYDGTLYIGGEFTAVYTDSSHTKSVPRNRFARILANGMLDMNWDPNVDGTVETIMTNSGSVYIGGTFKTVAGQTRNNIASFDVLSGKLLDWNPNANGTVLIMAQKPYDGSKLYVGGSFTTIGGESRNRIAQLDAYKGTALSWDPNADGQVNTLFVSENMIYAGGLFKNIGGKLKNNAAALDPSSGAATSFNLDTNGEVRSVYFSNNIIYLGGSFTSIAGQLKNNIAALDATAGTVFSWNPNTNGKVNAITANTGEVFAGGDFNAINGRTAGNFVALNLPSSQWGYGSIIWAASFNKAIRTIILPKSPPLDVYIGGNFTAVSDEAPYYFSQMAQTDDRTKSPSSWSDHGGFESGRSIQFDAKNNEGTEKVTSISIPLSLIKPIEPDYYGGKDHDYLSQYKKQISVDYAITGGTATINSDYTFVPGTVVFPNDMVAATIPLTVTDDALPEENETIVITLSNPIEASIGQNNTFTYTIIDNDGKRSGTDSGRSGGGSSEETGGRGGGDSGRRDSGGGGGGGSGSRSGGAIFNTAEKFNLKDIGKITDKKVADAILNIAERMEKLGTARFKGSFQPSQKTTYSFAAQLVLTIREIPCKPLTLKGCMQTAIDKHLLEKTNKRFITRADFYALLIKTAALPMMPVSAIDAEDLCSDVSKKDSYAQVIATARAYGIAKVKKNKCLPKLSFSRSEAVWFTLKTLEAMSK